ncbi:MAG: glycosyltransferase family 1 protein [Erysipelotrichales bacterium]|nr:glycosyltransferase family 1 protein [Erysipelotrichales bacterium]
MANDIKNVIRVAQVIGITGCGGVESVVMNYYKHIDRSKVQFDFLVEGTSKIIDKDKIEAMGGKIIIIPPYSNPFKYMKTLEKIFRQEKYDIVHSNMNALSVFTLRAAKKAGIKIRIVHSHSTSNKKEWKKTIIKNMLRPFSKKYATHFFGCSEYAAKWLFGNKLVENGRVEIINNAIDIDRFKFNQKTRDRIRLENKINDKFVVGHIGRFMLQKNHTFLLDIFYEIQKINEDSVLLLIGDGPLHDVIQKKVIQLNISDKVTFINLTNKPEDYYQAMDCFLLPSLYEGLPVVGVEAQINGLKCYLSDTITKETKIVETTKFISLKQSASTWAKQIVDDFTLQNAIRDESYNNDKFNITYQSKKLVELYQKYIEEINK